MKLLTLAKEKGRPARFVIRFKLQGTGAMLRPLLFFIVLLHRVYRAKWLISDNAHIPAKNHELLVL